MGTKATLLKKKYPGCKIPALPPDVDERIRILEQKITAPTRMVGSSLGGLTALMFAGCHPGRVRSMVLLAPAVGCTDETLFSPAQKKRLEALFVPSGIPAIIIAGLRDTLIPLDAIKAMIDRSPDPDHIELIVADDDHNLHHSLDLMLTSINRIMAMDNEPIADSVSGSGSTGGF